MFYPNTSDKFLNKFHDPRDPYYPPYFNIYICRRLNIAVSASHIENAQRAIGEKTGIFCKLDELECIVLEEGMEIPLKVK